MEIEWKIARVEYNRDDTDPDVILLTMITWEVLKKFPNPNYPSPEPSMPEPEFLFATVSGTLDFTYDRRVFDKSDLDNITQSDVVAWVRTKLGVARTDRVEQQLEQDFIDLINPPRGAFIPREDRDTNI